MPVENDKRLRAHLLYLLKGGGAHAGFDAAIEGLAVAMQGQRPRGAAHSRLRKSLSTCVWLSPISSSSAAIQSTCRRIGPPSIGRKRRLLPTAQRGAKARESVSGGSRIDVPAGVA